MKRSLIARQINEYFDGTKSLGDLEEWVVGHLQSVEDSADDSLLLINAIDASLMEYRDGIIEEEGLWAELGSILERAETVQMDVMNVKTFSFYEDDGSGLLDPNEVVPLQSAHPEYSS